MLEARTAPSSLYKYRSLGPDSRDFTRDIIMENRLWCGPASKLTDPLDCCPIPTLSHDIPTRREQLQKIFHDKHPPAVADALVEKMLSAPDDLAELMAEAIDELKGRIGVLSLSASGTIAAMWRNYADDHAGICLRFCDQQDHAPLFAEAKRVRYTPERPEIVAVPGPNRDFIEAYLFTKMDEWAFEDECRLVDPTYCGFVRFPPAALDAVILGPAISEVDRLCVLDWVRMSGSSTQLMQAQLTNHGETVTLVTL